MIASVKSLLIGTALALAIGLPLGGAGLLASAGSAQAQINVASKGATSQRVKLGLGGRAGSGRQYLSWITLADEVRAIRFLLDHDVSGPVNLTAPEPVTNSDYTRALGAALHRPTTILPMTGPRLLYGRELADSLLLTSQRVVPDVLLSAGFDFEQPTLAGALGSVLG